MAVTPQPSDWSDLPSDLAGLILCRLPSHAERVRFSYVCRQWQIAAQQWHPHQAPAFPWLAVSDGTYLSLPDGERHRLPLPNDARCCGSFDEWLFFERCKPANRLDKYFLLNPFSKAMISLPSQYREPLPPRHMRSATKTLIYKLIMCSSNHVVGALVTDRSGFRFMAFCQPGMSSWLLHVPLRFYQLQDIAFYRGKFYAVDVLHNLLTYELSNDNNTGELKIHRLYAITALKNQWRFQPDGMSYLVVSRDKLLMVYRKRFRRDGNWLRPPELRVSEADLDASQWSKVESLGDGHLLFIGNGCSKDLQVSHYDVRGNRLIFMDCNPMLHLEPQESNNVDCNVHIMTKEKNNLFLPDTTLFNDYRLTGSWLFPRA